LENVKLWRKDKAKEIGAIWGEDQVFPLEALKDPQKYLVPESWLEELHRLADKRKGETPAGREGSKKKK